MPMIHIWMHEGKSADYKEQLSEGIHAAMIDVLEVPEDTWDHVSAINVQGTWCTLGTFSTFRAAPIWCSSISSLTSDPRSSKNAPSKPSWTRSRSEVACGVKI